MWLASSSYHRCLLHQRYSCALVWDSWHSLSFCSCIYRWKFSLIQNMTIYVYYFFHVLCRIKHFQVQVQVHKGSVILKPFLIHEVIMLNHNVMDEKIVQCFYILLNVCFKYFGVSILQQNTKIATTQYRYKDTIGNGNRQSGVIRE